MRTLLSLSLSLALLTSLVLLSPMAARADNTLPTIYGGLVGGYSASTNNPTLDPMGIALGARVGLTLPTTDIYVGGLFLFHVGETSTKLSSSLISYEESAHSFMFGAEGGYEFHFGPVVIRPSLGIGMIRAASSNVADSILGGVTADSSKGALYLSPGAALMFVDGIMVGGEIRYNGVTTSKITDSVSLLATLGFAL